MTTKTAAPCFKAALVQLCSGREVDKNIAAASDLIRAAAAAGADYIQTPENTQIMELEKPRLMAQLQSEAGNGAVEAFAKLARGEQWDRNFEDGAEALRQMAAGQDIREMLRERTLICSPAQAAERIARYRDLGFTEIGFIARFTRLTHAHTVRTMELMTHEVLPRLK